MIHYKTALPTAAKSWLPLAVTIVLLSGLVYAAVQQNYRQSANDPQIQITQDVASAIAQGSATADNIVPANPTVDMSQSLSAFVIIYTATGTPIGGSVMLDGKLPTLPSGVLDFAKAHGQDRFTWQPKTNVRVAAVVTPFLGPNPGYVLAGRLLTEVEKREMQLELMCAIGGLVTLVLTFLTILYTEADKARKAHYASHVEEHHHAA